MRPPTALQARRMVALLEMLSEAAASGSGCPSNSAIADRLEMSSVTEVQSLLKRMTTEGLIRVDHTGNRRRATILATGEVADWTIYSRGRPMASAGKTAGSSRVEPAFNGDLPAARYVDRSICPRCGVRSDVGCRHRGRNEPRPVLDGRRAAPLDGATAAYARAAGWVA